MNNKFLYLNSSTLSRSCFSDERLRHVFMKLFSETQNIMKRLSKNIWPLVRANKLFLSDSSRKLNRLFGIKKSAETADINGRVSQMQIWFVIQNAIWLILSMRVSLVADCLLKVSKFSAFFSFIIFNYSEMEVYTFFLIIKQTIRQMKAVNNMKKPKLKFSIRSFLRPNECIFFVAGLTRL